MQEQYDHTLIDEYIERINRTRDLNECSRLLCECGAALGFPMIFYAVVDQALEKQLPLQIPLIGNFNEEWIERYMSSGYLRDDPVASMSLQSKKIVRWEPFHEELRYKGILSSRAQLVFDERSTFHDGGGVSVPIHTADGLAGVVSAVPDGSPCVKRKTIDAQFLSLFYFAHRFHDALASMLWNTDPSSNNPLTKRQQECLKWSAHGKTSWEISKILGISPPSVEKHIRQAMNRLNSNTRTHAVADAIRRRLIDL